MFTSDLLEKTFNDVFFDVYKTKLVGGFEEPFYQASRPDGVAQIQYRYDYLSSALHEVSHWCVAGVRRRALDDYGYWYAEDGRTLEQQTLFERVEVIPQAYECLFHWSLGLSFQVSIDNLALPEYDSLPFERAVYNHVYRLVSGVLPSRVERFANALYLYADSERQPLKDYLRECYENTCR